VPCSFRGVLQVVYSTVRYFLALLLFVFAGASYGVGLSQGRGLRDLVGADFEARVVSVVDGDTVDVLLRGDTRSVRIRLEGVDSPERGEAFNERARVFTRVLLFDKQVRGRGTDVDRYGRLVARLIVGGADASVELVQAGLACHYTDYSSDAVLAKGEIEARQAGRGFWARGVQRPRCALQVPGGAGVVATPSQQPIVGIARFHGNTNSRVYHTATCRNFNCGNCTRVFTTEEDARAAGFRPAGDCLTRR
jgi:endonuclease YncB( thermonuclease family)